MPFAGWLWLGDWDGPAWGEGSRGNAAWVNLWVRRDWGVGKPRLAGSAGAVPPLPPLPALPGLRVAFALGRGEVRSRVTPEVAQRA